MYTDTIAYMPADKQWTYDRKKSPLQNCPALHETEIFLLLVSQVELIYHYTSNVLIIDEIASPCYSADGFCKSTTKPFTLVWFVVDFCLLCILQEFVGRLTKIEDRQWIETEILYTLQY